MFGYPVAWNKILTCDNLIKQGFSLVGWCCLCRCSGETLDHLLIHCDIAYVLWSLVFRIFGIHWMLLRRVIDLLFGWRNCFRKHSSEIWNFVALCLMWLLWKEQNGHIF